MGGAGAFQAGGTQFGGGSLGGAGGGGFTYGMASSAGSVFGAPSTASTAAPSAGLGGGTQFGQSSSMLGGMSSGVGQGTAGLFNFGGAS